MSGPFTAFGNLYNLVQNINALVGFSSTGGTETLVSDIEFTNNALELTYGDSTTASVDLGSLNTLMPFTKLTLLDDSNDVVKEAFADYLGFLPDLTDAFDNDDTSVSINLPAKQTSGAYSRPRGKMLRFFNSTPTNAGFYYIIKDNNVDVLTILPQEAYTMVWTIRGTNPGSWTIIPGIINPKSRPDAFTFEALPT